MHYFLCLCGLALTTTASAEEFVQRFGGGRYDTKLFRPTGTDPSRAVYADEAGLRLYLPADYGNRVPVGVVPGLGVRGDFEITLAFEVLQIERPTTGQGAGLSLYLTMVSPTQEAVAISRMVRPGGPAVFTAVRASTPPGGSRQYHGGQPLPVEAAAGMMRLVRRGETLSFQVAQGNSTIFRELYSIEWGTGDIDMVRLAAENGGSPTVVDILLKWVSIRADELGPARPLPPPARWSWWWLLALLAMALAALGYRLRYSRPSP